MGCSVLREIDKNDILNGNVTSISGGKIYDIKKSVEAM